LWRTIDHYEIFASNVFQIPLDGWPIDTYDRHRLIFPYGCPITGATLGIRVH